ncbi:MULTISPECIES: insulinase family protein [unclassified Pseudomonas]|uniref:M16 family metallopeptidase n=1 Tax=unclassified Pseudomonas TaxID=196821 RepID=UPI000D35F878|nr:MULTISPECIES: insulinase family protein [unclassified Pseudomonas]RAU39427.1 insulinase family protein [Pseudomonas sp. RIT 409]RAU45680.1 insulinase family protein [Pseudomonas sp. RIT 412]
MRCLLFAVLLLTSFTSMALDRFQVEGYVLPNGLQLLLKPAEKGHVSIRLVVGVGFDDFPCADKELPHLLEHLLFSGIDDAGEGGLERQMQALGGEWNAFTSNTDTTFVIEAPAQNQRKVLDLLLDVLTRTQINQANLDMAKRIVEREDGGHYSHLQRWLDKRDLGHSASNQLAVELGLKCAERPEVDHLTLEQVEALHDHWYASNNMTLIIVGDLDKLLPAYLERTYGQLNGVDPTEHPPLATISEKAEPERTLMRGFVGNGARLHLFFPEPDMGEQHDETWDLVKAYLDWSLYSELRLDKGYSYGPWADREAFGDTGLLSLNADLDRDDVEAAITSVRAMLERLRKEGMDPATFARLQQASIAKQAWAAQGNSALADYYWGALNDYADGRFEDPGKRTRAVSLDLANRALRQMLTQPGYLRIEEPLLGYDALYEIGIALAAIVGLLIVWRWRVYKKRPS